MQFDYFYGSQAEQFSFYRIPKVLFTDPQFKPLSTDAKVLYGILLDRMSLSVKNHWLDEQSRVYIIFTTEEIMEALSCANQYDYCLIDCSPSVGLLLTNALAAANEIIIPMQAQPFSVVGMSQLTSSIANVQRKINPGLRVKGILLTMTEHTNVSDHYCGQVRSTYGNKIHIFTTEIPRNVKVQESQANAEPTILYDPKSNSAKAYIEFAKEVSGYGREEQVFERDEDALNR